MVRSPLFFSRSPIVDILYTLPQFFLSDCSLVHRQIACSDPMLTPGKCMKSELGTSCCQLSPGSMVIACMGMMPVVGLVMFGRGTYFQGKG